MLDAIASRYSTDPWTVLAWEPARLTLALMCFEARGRTMAQMQRASKGGLLPLPVPTVAV